MPDLSGIDPSILNPIFKGADTINTTFPFASSPILLDTAKPIRIPWEFRSFHPVDTSHEEPTDLALSDYEGRTDLFSYEGEVDLSDNEGGTDLSGYKGGVDLPDSDGETDVPTTLERRTVEKREATKYPYKIRKPGERQQKLSKSRQARDSIRSRKSISKSIPGKSHSPIKVSSQRKARSPIKEHTTIE
jgi:hypothetical protein